MTRDLAAVVAMGALLALAHVIAILLAIPFIAVDVRAFPDPNAVSNALVYVALILGMTGVMLVLIRWKREAALRYIILGAFGLTMLFVFSIPLTLALSFLPSPWWDISSLALPLAITGGLVYALIRYPEWYVVNIAGLSVAVGATALIGISFGILPALVLLVALAIYDAWAVYRTRHMLVLAGAVSGLKLPILLVVPKRFPFSFIKQPGLEEQLASGDERAAMYMGLGDIIIPGILVVSAFASLPDVLPVAAIAPKILVALGTLLGTLVGFGLLMTFVTKGKPQAGLPLLNSGAILGYLISYLLVFRDLSLGIVL